MPADRCRAVGTNAIDPARAVLEERRVVQHAGRPAAVAAADGGHEPAQRPARPLVDHSWPTSAVIDHTGVGATGRYWRSSTSTGARQQLAQRGDGIGGRPQALLHRGQVGGDDRVASRRVVGVQDGPHVVDRHLEVAQPAHDVGIGDLVGRVVAVSGRRVDGGRLEQPDGVVVAQRGAR